MFLLNGSMFHCNIFTAYILKINCLTKVLDMHEVMRHADYTKNRENSRRLLMTENPTDVAFYKSQLLSNHILPISR